jgi:hypothetical protein
MKAIKPFVVISLFILWQNAQGQGFLNLAFENTTITTIHNPGGDTYAATTPGWTVNTVNYVNGDPNSVPYNNIAIDSPAVNLEGTDCPFPSVRAIAGNYSFFLQGGSRFSLNTDGASIGQIGQIPTGALSLIYWGSSMNVSFDGQSLGLVVLGSTPNYNIYGADISAFVGQTGQLLFSVPWQSGAILDNIQFSTSSVPEPSTFALVGLGGLAFGLFKKRQIWLFYANSSFLDGFTAAFHRLTRPNGQFTRPNHRRAPSNHQLARTFYRLTPANHRLTSANHRFTPAFHRRAGSNGHLTATFHRHAPTHAWHAHGFQQVTSPNVPVAAPNDGLYFAHARRVETFSRLAGCKHGLRSRPPRRSFADEVQRHAAGVRVRAMFPEINSLPRPQRELTGAHGQRKIHGRQRGANVRGHVVLALGGVNEQRIAIRHEPREKGVEVAAHVGIGIFLDEQRSGGVAQMQGEESVAKFIFRKPLFHGAGELH